MFLGFVADEVVDDGFEFRRLFRGGEGRERSRFKGVGGDFVEEFSLLLESVLFPSERKVFEEEIIVLLENDFFDDLSCDV